MEVQRGRNRNYNWGVCVRRAIYSALTVKYYTVVPFVRRQLVSSVPFVTAHAETNLSEWKIWWQQDEHIRHIKLTMWLYRHQCQRMFSLFHLRVKVKFVFVCGAMTSFSKIFCFISSWQNLSCQILGYLVSFTSLQRKKGKNMEMQTKCVFCHWFLQNIASFVGKWWYRQHITTWL